MLSNSLSHYYISNEIIKSCTGT